MGHRWARPTTAPFPMDSVAWLAPRMARSTSPTSRLRCRIEADSSIYKQRNGPPDNVIQRAASPSTGALRGWQIGVAVGFGHIYGLGELALGEQEVRHALPLGGVVEAGLAASNLPDR